MNEPTNQFFVYGTLKRGFRNDSVWPAEPISIQNAWVRGQLYGHARYPAMKAGQDRVAGEVWKFETLHVSRVLESLDLLEGTNGNSPDDLYHRVIVEVYDYDNESLGLANTYHYVRDTEQDGFVRILPDASAVQSGQPAYVAWPATS